MACNAFAEFDVNSSKFGRFPVNGTHTLFPKRSVQHKTDECARLQANIWIFLGKPFSIAANPPVPIHLDIHIFSDLLICSRLNCLVYAFCYHRFPVKI